MNPLIPSFGDVFITIGCILATALAVIAFISLVGSSLGAKAKFRWVLVILFVPIAGSLLWLSKSSRTSDKRHTL